MTLGYTRPKWVDLVSLVMILALIIPLFPQPHAFGQEPYGTPSYSWMKTVSLPALAVSSGGEGVVSNLTITLAYPGSGRVFFSSEPLTMIDSQASARIAFVLAADLAGVDHRLFDAFVSLESPSLVIGGPSAGAVMTIGFLSLFTGLPVNGTVAMTGMVYPDGTIGPVGGVKAKLEAAAAAGYKVFLVPAGESIVIVESVERTLGGLIVRREPLNLTEYGQELGIKVVEVASVQEAAQYFLVGWRSEPGPEGVPSYSEEAVRLFTEWVEDLNTTRSELVAVLNNSLDSGFINQSNEFALRSLEFMSKGKYYIAASYMFTAVALAEAAYVKATVEEPAELEQYIYQVNETINRVLKLIEQAEPTNISSLEALVTARQRINDARQLLEQAIQGVYTVYDPLTGRVRLVIEDSAAVALAFAKWRGIVAENWLEYSRIPSPSISEEDLRKAANDLMGLAGTVVSYYNSLLQDLGQAPQESPSIAYQEGVSRLVNGDVVGALSYFMQSLADSMVGLHSVFDYQPRRIAEILKTELTRKLSAGDYTSIIALGYLELGIENLEKFDETGNEESLLSSIRLFTLGSLQDALTRYLSPSDTRSLPITVTVEQGERVERTITVTETVTETGKQVSEPSASTVTVTVTTTETIQVTVGGEEGLSPYVVLLILAVVTAVFLVAVKYRNTT